MNGPRGGAALLTSGQLCPGSHEGPSVPTPTISLALPRRMPTPHREQRAPLRDPAALAVLARICAMDAALYEEARAVMQEAKRVCSE